MTQRGSLRRVGWYAAALVVGLHATAGETIAQEAGTLRGRVRDENNRPVSFAQLELRPADRRVVTDERGEFTIGGIADGEYELRVRRIGYEPLSIAVRIPFDEPALNVTLIALPRLLDSVRIRERGPAFRYTGIVLDDFEQPVTNAEVIAAGASDHGVRTDSAGHFRLAKAQKGTIVLRIRKFGYSPYFGSLSLGGEREDTIWMKRHAQDLPEAYVRAESGFGRDTFAFVELDSRMRWKSPMAGIASREDLDKWGDMDLCHALIRTLAGAKTRMTERSCGGAMCVLIDGLQPLVRPLTAFLASEVEAVEMHPRDQTGTVAQRIGMMCKGFYSERRQGGGIVIWMRKRP